MASQYKDDNYNRQLLFFAELDELQLPICIVCDENEGVLQVSNHKVVKLGQLVSARNLHKLLLHNALEVKEERSHNCLFAASLGRGEGPQKGLRLKELRHAD